MLYFPFKYSGFGGFGFRLGSFDGDEYDSTDTYLDKPHADVGSPSLNRTNLITVKTAVKNAIAWVKDAVEAPTYVAAPAQLYA